MAESVDRYFRVVLGGRRVTSSGRLWCPAADVYRTCSGWVVKVELAGVDPKDVEVRVDADRLIISGIRRDTFYGDGVAYQQLEIAYSRFEKVLQFPCDIGKVGITRDFVNGLLILSLEV